MVEKIDVYDIKGHFLGVEERTKFYSEIKKEFDEKGRVSRKTKSIRLILMNSNGRIYLQKRSKLKNDNPGLYDKTIGGHVSAGDSFDMTMIKESAEELGFPAAIISKKEFKRSLKVTDLNIVGLLNQIDYMDNFISKRKSRDGSFFIQPYICAFYIGYYDGAIRFVDGESSGIEVFSLEELKKEIKDNPNKFTDDIKFMIKRYEGFLKPIN